MKKKILIFTFLIIIWGVFNTVYANNVVTVASSESGVVADFYDDNGLDSALQTNQKVKLLSDININKDIKLENAVRSLDLNGKKININSGNGFLLKSTHFTVEGNGTIEGGAGFELKEKSDLEVHNGIMSTPFSAYNESELYFINADVDKGQIISENGKVFIRDGKFGYINANGGILTVYGGTLKNIDIYNTKSAIINGIFENWFNINSSDAIIISNGIFNGNLYINDSNVEIENGIFKKGIEYYDYDGEKYLNIYNGEFGGEGIGLIFNYNSNAKLYGGNFLSSEEEPSMKIEGFEDPNTNFDFSKILGEDCYLTNNNWKLIEYEIQQPMSLSRENEWPKKAYAFILENKTSVIQKYLIEIEQVENGKIEANKEKAAKGEEIQLIIEPDIGYEIKEIKIKTLSEEFIVENDKFIMPEENVIIVPEFKKIEIDNNIEEDNNIEDNNNIIKDAEKDETPKTGTFDIVLYILVIVVIVSTLGLVITKRQGKYSK